MLGTSPREIFSSMRAPRRELLNDITRWAIVFFLGGGVVFYNDYVQGTKMREVILRRVGKSLFRGKNVWSFLENVL